MLLRETAAELDLTIHALEVMPDHLHLFIEADPRRCVAEIVNRLKGISSRALRGEFPALRSRLPTLWSLASTVGTVSAKTIQRYIEQQKGQ